ncbi:MAG: hypothetical protein WD716_12915 [Fimbriimonadaceae bacterium]
MHSFELSIERDGRLFFVQGPKVRAERRGILGEPSETSNVFFPAGSSTPPSELLEAA